MKQSILGFPTLGLPSWETAPRRHGENENENENEKNEKNERNERRGR